MTLLKQVVMHNPLGDAVCSPEEVWQMVDEMLFAQAEWLAQYAGEIDAAKERLKYPTVAAREWTCAARQNVYSVEDLRAAQKE